MYFIPSSKKLSLVIEVDGDSHYHPEQVISDADRENQLRSLGLSFLRFDDLDVKRNLAFVLAEINHFIEHFEKKIPQGQLTLPPFSEGE